MQRDVMRYGVRTALVLGFLSAVAHAGVYDDLVKRLPDDPNVLVLMDAKAIRGSKFFQTEVTDAKGPDKDARARQFPVPNVEKAVLGAQISDFETSRPNWQMAVLQSGSRISLEDVAHYRGGKLEKVSGVDAVRLRDDSYLVTLASKLTAVVSPANRQFVGRVAKRDVSPGSTPLPDYLQNVVKHVGSGGYQLAMAIDLENMIDAGRVRERVANFGSLSNQKGKFDHVVQVLSSLKGAMLEVRFGVAAKATFTVDFGEDATTLQTFAKPFLQEVLDNFGARLDDLSAWSTEVKGKQIVFAGDISLGGLRKVLSLIDTDPQVADAPSMHPTSDTPKEDQAAAQASLRHFRMIQSLLSELRDPKNVNSFGSGENGLWYEKYAKKIDQLPVLNVDKDLLDYSAEVATRLRIQSAKFRSVGIKSGAQSREQNYWYYYYSNPYYGNSYSYGRTESNYDATRRVETSSAASEKVDQLREIDEATSRIRRAMTAKYQIEF